MDSTGLFQEKIIIRNATAEDARQIAEILVEDWQIAYQGIIDSAYLDAMSVEERYRRESQRYRQYTVAAEGDEILGFSWNEMTGDEAADCEIIALYVSGTQKETAASGGRCFSIRSRFSGRRGRSA